MATYTKRGKKWFTQIRKKGVHRNATFSSKAAAQLWANEIELSIERGDYAQATGKTFFDACLRYGEEVLPGKKSYTKEIKHLDFLMRELPFVSLPIEKITTAVIAQWRDDRLKEVSPATVNRNINLISSVFEIARREWQWIQTNPVRDVKKPQAPRPRDLLYTDAQIDALAAELYGPARGLFLFALETAMRRGEMLALEWQDINLAGRFITIRDSKNGDKREVPLTLRAVEILHEQTGDKPFDIKLENFSTQFKRAKQRLGIDLHFHDTRATALTRLSKKLSPLQLAKIVGHRDLKSLLIYYRESATDIALSLD